MSRHKYTDEQRAFIKENVKGRTTIELTELFNKKFDTKIEVRKIRAFMKNHKLTNGITTCFVKGQVPFNKGKTWNEYMSKEGQKNSRKTIYKKGNKPAGTLPIGSEWIDKDGYLYIKTKDVGRRFGRTGMWQPYHHLVWMQYYGDIPPNHIILFLDKDKSNFDINNLQLVSRSELLIINKNKMLTSYQEVNKTVTILAKVIDKSGRIKK